MTQPRRKPAPVKAPKGGTLRGFKIHMTEAQYVALSNIAEDDHRKIKHMAEVMVIEGIDRRSAKA